jgi:hypothetical protein
MIAARRRYAGEVYSPVIRASRMTLLVRAMFRWFAIGLGYSSSVLHHNEHQAVLKLIQRTVHAYHRKSR